MNLNDWNDEYNQLSSAQGIMNFDDNEEPRLAINLDSEDQRLGARDDLGLGISANDVLCGRGKTSFNHVGNRRFRHIISEAIDDYNNAGSRKGKSAVVKKVHDIIRAAGGRFLKMDASERTWIELSQQRSLEKVSHAIRDATTTNENMKKKKKKVHDTIAQVAAHVTSRFPSVHLEGNFGGDDDDQDGSTSDRFAFTSIDDSAAATNISNLPIPPMPPLPGLIPSSAAALTMPSRLLGTVTSALSPEPTGSSSSSAAIAAAAALESRIVAEVSGYPGLQSPTPHLEHAQHPEDDFVTFINEVLGPVSPTDLETDPLKRLGKKETKGDR